MLNPVRDKKTCTGGEKGEDTCNLRLRVKKLLRVELKSTSGDKTECNEVEMFAWAVQGET